MKADDIVDLVIVTPHNFLYVSGIPRQQASDTIREWFHARDTFSKCRWLYRVWRTLRCWLSLQTFAINYEGEEPGTTFAQWAIGAESIIGMYIKEREISVQERLVQTQERLVKAVTREVNQGEEWRGED